MVSGGDAAVILTVSQAEPLEILESEEDFEKERYVVKYKIHAKETIE